jgi:1-carboxybiuret hydrolase subunit AtzG-like protein
MGDDRKIEPDHGGAVDRIAEAIGLEIAAAHRPGVVENFTRIAALASLVMAFPLPDDSEIGQIFVP